MRNKPEQLYWCQYTCTVHMSLLCTVNKRYKLEFMLDTYNKLLNSLVKNCSVAGIAEKV